MKLGMEIGLGPSDTVLDGDSAPPPQKKRRGHSPQFSVHNYCDQTARCIRIPLSTEVGLGPGDIVLDGDPASPPFKRGTDRHSSTMSIVAKQLDASRCHFI